jgi:hypothetical protein
LRLCDFYDTIRRVSHTGSVGYRLNDPASFPKIGRWMVGKEVCLYLDRAFSEFRVTVDVRIEKEGKDVR